MDDVFERDEEIMRFYGMAMLYRNARIKLIALEMNEEERLLHKKLSRATKPTQLFIRTLLDRIAQWEEYDAIKEELEEALRGQARILDLLTNLVPLTLNNR